MIVLTLFLFASLEKMGALDWNKIVHQNQGWRLISCIWLHAGLIHLVVNMLSLLFIGIRLEQQFGFGKFFLKKKIIVHQHRSNH
jgi:membrane associated rhomboid family serine protease